MKPLPRELAVFLLFCALTAVMTWPLVAHLGDVLPHPHDPAINTWILDWDLHALLHRGVPLFDANIFHPEKDTLAYSENLIGIAIVLLPLKLAGVTPIAIYNIATLLAFALSGYGAYVLARLVTQSTGASIASGIYFAFFAFRLTHLTHLQHLWACWLPLMLAALLWFAREPNANRATLFAIAFLMNGLTNLHWLAFGSVAIAMTFLVVARRDRRYWIGGIAAFAIASALLVPVLLPYKRVSERFSFRGDVNETRQYSAEPRDWLISSVNSRWYAGPLARPSVNPERWLFPGALVLLFAAIGLMRSDRITAIALLWIALGFIGSLGLNFAFGRLLFEHVPLFRGIRAPARWAFIAYSGLALLAACGIARLPRRLHVFVCAALLIELHAAPLLFYNVVPEAPVYQFLGSSEFLGVPRSGASSGELRGTRGTPIVELPLTQEDQYEYLLRSTTHHRPMVNGVSGFTPPHFAELVSLADTPKFLPRLEELGVTTVVVHGDRVSDATREWLRAQPLKLIRRFDAAVDGDFVFATRRHPDYARIDADAQQRENLARFLAHEPVRSDDTFGYVESPSPNGRVRGKLRVAGWALSPWGVNEVLLRFRNGNIVVAADLVPRNDVSALYPWYPRTTRAGFVKEFDAPPFAGDLVVEIVDGRGRRKRLGNIWFSWER
ncbi:MAG: hypothetical protein M3Q69_01160 [Acidobacteriota bacterium]|nr:hypothetical protein [Acidobacteriota bacterium]